VIHQNCLAVCLGFDEVQNIVWPALKSVNA
jgi:hypothetical protein